MHATLTELAARVAETVLSHADEITFANAVDDLVAEVLDDAADEVEATFGDLGSAEVFATIVVAVAERRLRASIVSSGPGAAAA
jgi:phage gp36-like protein